MKAVVFCGIGDIRLEEVRDPKIIDSADAIVALTASAICGTDLHMIRGTVSGMKKGTILGHEGVGSSRTSGRMYGIPLENTLFFAGEATDMSGHNGTVHGAIRSGYRAAREILKALG